MENETKVNLGERVKGEIELPTIDVTKYIGRKEKIELVGEFEGKHGFYVKVQTVVLDTITGGKEDIKLRASVLLGLQEDAQGNIGWGKETKMGLFLKKHNVTHYNDLVGIEVIIQTRTGKSGREFLTF